VHRIANVLDKLPRSLQPRAKQALHEIMYAETRAAAEREIVRFTVAYQAKYPKAVRRSPSTGPTARVLISLDPQPLTMARPRRPYLSVAGSTHKLAGALSDPLADGYKSTPGDVPSLTYRRRFRHVTEPPPRRGGLICF
jgi:hypothetical protein